MDKTHLATIVFVLAVSIVLGLGTFAFSRQSDSGKVTVPDEGSYPSVYDIAHNSPSVKTEYSGAILDKVYIDFGSCIPGKASVYVAFGSDHVIVTGLEGEDCILYLGGERENPRWNGQLSIRCRVPQNKGSQQFPSLRFDFLSEYTLLCGEQVPQTS
jgi:hypothetical protein